MTKIKVMSQVQEAELIVVNHSGGKDSQAMLAVIKSLGLKAKIVVVHADLGEMEWEPMAPFIRANSFGHEVHVVEPKLSFFELCRKYSRLPSGQARFCTDQLKTQPIKKWLREYCEANGFKKVINAIGIRAEESPARAKKEPFKVSDCSLKKTGLEVFDWFPIFDFKLADVWSAISEAGQKPHEVYSKGFSRLSCVFCVFGRIGEHEQAAKLRPELFAKVAQLERDLGKTIRVKQVKGVKYPKFLDEYLNQTTQKGDE